MTFLTKACESERVKATMAPLVLEVVQQCLAALVGRHRRWQGRLDQVELGEEVGAEGALELLGADLLDALLRVPFRGVVNQDI